MTTPAELNELYIAYDKLDQVKSAWLAYLRAPKSDQFLRAGRLIEELKRVLGINAGVGR